MSTAGDFAALAIDADDLRGGRRAIDGHETQISEFASDASSLRHAWLDIPVVRERRGKLRRIGENSRAGLRMRCPLRSLQMSPWKPPLDMLLNPAILEKLP